MKKAGGKKGKKIRKKGIAVGVGPKLRPTAVDRIKSKQSGRANGNHMLIDTTSQFRMTLKIPLCNKYDASTY